MTSPVDLSSDPPVTSHMTSPVPSHMTSPFPACKESRDCEICGTRTAKFSQLSDSYKKSASLSLASDRSRVSAQYYNRSRVSVQYYATALSRVGFLCERQSIDVFRK